MTRHDQSRQKNAVKNEQTGGGYFLVNTNIDAVGTTSPGGSSGAMIDDGLSAGIGLSPTA